ncbi:MAG: hypothetical protein FJW83_03240 [Actinobacteria bacterium]|nr:hypothetical protein [Actinomycetota bacterium]
MSEDNDQNPPRRRPAPTETFRIVGAEEAGAIVARQTGSQPRVRSFDDLLGGDPTPERPPLFASVPDGPEDDPWDDAPAPGAAVRPTPEAPLQHWTEPPTGQVPRVLLDDDADDAGWSAFAASPRWQDPANDFEADDFSDLADPEPTERRRAADPVRPVIDDFFSLDDDGADDLELPPPPAIRAEAPAAAERLDAPPQRVRTSPPRAGRSGSVVDPIAALGPEASEGDPFARRRGNGGGGTSGRNVPVAVGVGVTLAVVAIVLFRIGPLPTVVLAALVIGAGAVEYFGALQRAGRRPATLLGIVASFGLPLAAYWRGPGGALVVVGLTVVLGFLWYLGDAVEGVVTNLSATLFGVVWIGGGGAFAGLLLRGGGSGYDATSALLAIVLPTVAHDVFGYVVGRNAGRTPLLPSVSPNKTTEGTLGGVLGAVIVSVLFNAVILDTPFGGLGTALLLGLAVGVLAPLGDLAESLVKRDLGVKDLGVVLPGHGGVLDRFDSLLFALPGGYAIAQLAGILPF